MAGGISEALVLTFEGVGLSVPAIYFFAVFRNRVSSLSAATMLVGDEFIRGTNAPCEPSQRRGRWGRRPAGGIPASDCGQPDGGLLHGSRTIDRKIGMSDPSLNEATCRAESDADAGHGVSAGHVFHAGHELQGGSLDLSLKLPVVGSAKMVDTKGPDDLLVLNIDAEGRLKRLWRKRRICSRYIADRGA